MKIVTSSLAKFIDCLHTNLSLTGGYTETTSSLYQQQQLYPLTVKSYRAETKIDSKVASWLNLEAKIVWSQSLLDDEKNPKRTTESVRSNMAGYFFPVKDLYVSLSAEYSYKENSTGNATHYLFADAKINYKKNKWETELLYQNLFNHRRYENMSYSELTASYTSLPLRGSNVLATLRYNF